MQAVHIAASVSLFQAYPFHLASTICEWIAAFSLILFFLTYINDFKVSMGSSNASLFLKKIYRWKRLLFLSLFISYSCLPYEWKQSMRSSLDQSPTASNILYEYQYFPVIKCAAFKECSYIFIAYILHFTRQGF